MKERRHQVNTDFSKSTLAKVRGKQKGSYGIDRKGFVFLKIGETRIFEYSKRLEA